MTLRTDPTGPSSALSAPPSKADASTNVRNAANATPSPGDQPPRPASASQPHHKDSDVATDESDALAAALDTQRLIGRVRGRRPGPLVVVIGGMHGNEPGGVVAAERVLAHLAAHPRMLRGEVIGLRGNPPALAQGERYIDRDLNRRWYAADIAALLSRDPQTDSHEDAEQRSLLDTIARIETYSRSAAPHVNHRVPTLWIDLHSTSSGGAPFCACSDTVRNVVVARRLPIPLILGLEECLDGAFLGYLTDVGHRCLVVEGGQHNDPKTPDFLESALWMTLAAAGLVQRRRLGTKTWREHRRQLAETAEGLPRAVAIRYRHAITAQDGFQMEPGMSNFQRVGRGARLGSDRHGAVSARYAAARVLMPLYQGLGEDGFFLSHDVSPWHLWLSRALRRTRLDRLLARLLPGVKRIHGTHDHLTLNTVDEHNWRARLLRLLGYRRCYKDPEVESRLHMRRRRQDHAHAEPQRPW